MGVPGELWDGGPGWLNTASYGLPPRPAWDALQVALHQWRTGATDWEAWDEATHRARSSFARLVKASPADVAVGSTVAAALAPVAAALPEGATVVVHEAEFTSNVFPWQVHASRGVRVVPVSSSSLLEAIRPGVDLVAVSAVQSSTGEVLDLPPVVAACDAVDAHLVVDASQAAGWLPLDAGGVDVLVAHGYKWLMSPRGATFCYLSPPLREGLRPLNASWYAAEDVMGSFYGTRMDLARDARRFDQSPAWFSLVGAAAALEVIEQIGVPVIHRHDVALANRFRAGLGLPPGDSAIVTADRPGAASALAAAGIRAAVRADRVRLSFHAYNTEADVDRALEALLGGPASGRPAASGGSESGAGAFDETVRVGADPEIVEAEAALRAAQLAGDVDALDELIDDDLLFAGPDGRLATKADDLAAYRSGTVRFELHEPVELSVRRLGDDVAIASLETLLRVRVDDEPVEALHRYTRVWRRRDGRWRVVGGQVAPMPDPSKPARP